MKVGETMNNKMYSIKIKDSNGNLIGERMNASVADIECFISKGFKVYDQHDNLINESELTSTIGVSDGFIET